MAHQVTLIPGDGIGPEVITAARRILDATGVPIDWDVQDAGAAMIAKAGTPLPDAVIESIRRTGVALKGPIGTPVGSGFRSVNVALRQALTLYANVRPIRSYRGVRSPFDDVDLVIVRENTEDLYVGIEHQVGDYGAVGFKVTTRKGSERIARFAFDFAAKMGRRQVTAVHKATLMDCSDGLFLASCRRIAGKYPTIAYSERLVDNLAAEMIRRPRNFDVLVLPNLYGDIYSDLCAGLVGGLGVAPGANIGEHGAVFEPVHGTAPDIAGQNKANPTAAILSSVMMLEHLGEFEAAARVAAATESVLAEGWAVTADLGGSATTTQMTDAILRRLETTVGGVVGFDANNRVADMLKLASVARGTGPVWNTATDDLALTLNTLQDGDSTKSYVNPEFDVLVVVLEGEGTLEIAGERYPLHPGEVALAPRGARRQITATDRLVYLSVNRRPATP